jgi:hypothetical protein
LSVDWIDSGQRKEREEAELEEFQDFGFCLFLFSAVVCMSLNPLRGPIARGRRKVGRRLNPLLQLAVLVMLMVGLSL